MTIEKSGLMARKDATVETIRLLTESADKGHLSGLLQMAADLSERVPEGGSVGGPKRRPAFSIRLPRRTRSFGRLSDADHGILFWGYGLVCALHNALDGARRTRIYLTTGRKAPAPAAVLVAADLFRQSGLTVRLKDRRPDARIITIGF